MLHPIDISYAIERGWIKPKPMVRLYDKWAQANIAKGLTARGTPRKSRPPIRAEIIAAAKRDGVGVTAIYNRIKRTGRITLRRK